MCALEEGTFYGCRSFRRAEVPSGVERIGKQCFEYSGIEEVTLPGALREIGENAFYGCSRLGTVWVEEGCTLDVAKHVGRRAVVRCK